MFKKIFVLIAVLLVCSVAANVWFIAGKGIQITNTYNQQQYQNQQQMQIMMGLMAAKGKVTWKVVHLGQMSAMNLAGETVNETITNYMNTLPPESALFAKVHNTSVFVPEFKEDDK